MKRESQAFISTAAAHRFRRCDESPFSPYFFVDENGKLDRDLSDGAPILQTCQRGQVPWQFSIMWLLKMCCHFEHPRVSELLGLHQPQHGVSFGGTVRNTVSIRILLFSAPFSSGRCWSTPIHQKQSSNTLSMIGRPKGCVVNLLNDWGSFVKYQ